MLASKLGRVDFMCTIVSVSPKGWYDGTPPPFNFKVYP